MSLSKTKIDKAGIALSKGQTDDIIKFIEFEDAFDEYRKNHLQPLSETTVELQNILNDYTGDYYIAQRLKRKPQILRKLRRFSVRLSQLQDIGGFRIIVHRNADVDSLIQFIKERTSGTGIIALRKSQIIGKKEETILVIEPFI